jgi:hypothetical protein
MVGYGFAFRPPCALFHFAITLNRFQWGISYSLARVRVQKIRNCAHRGDGSKIANFERAAENGRNCRDYGEATTAEGPGWNMAGMNLTQARIQEFIAALERADGSSGNGNLRRQLGWEEEFYWKVQERLIADGRVVAGRGRGGSVRLSNADATVSEPEAVAAAVSANNKERTLYAPLKASIEGKWIKRFGFDDVIVDETHSRGAKDTGGTFTRPDITAAGYRGYVYLPKRLEVITFEVKPSEAVSIMGVLKAIAHREAAHRAYVMFATSPSKFETAVEYERIAELAQKYGVGIVLTEKPDDVENWEIVLEAIRHDPDPARLDRFLGDLPSDNMKKQLMKWKG